MLLHKRNVLAIREQKVQFRMTGDGGVIVLHETV
jgi:hypothetical protein